MKICLCVSMQRNKEAGIGQWGSVGNSLLESFKYKNGGEKIWKGMERREF